MKKSFVQIECSKLTRFLKDLEGFIEDDNGDEEDDDEEDDDEEEEKDKEDEKDEENSEDYSEDDDVEEFIIEKVLGKKFH